MPTKFRLDLQEPLRSNISGQTAAVRSKRDSGEWCSYPQFVENLGKPLDRMSSELHHHTTGMAGEAGELLDASKKVWIYDKPVDVEHIVEEMGDLRWYYQAMLNMLGLTDEDIQAANTIKLRKRYPEGVYSNEQAIQRADKAIPVGTNTRKFMGMPAPEPKTRHPSTYVSSSDMKPLPDDVHPIAESGSETARMHELNQALDRERAIAMGNRVASHERQIMEAMDAPVCAGPKCSATAPLFAHSPECLTEYNKTTGVA